MIPATDRYRKLLSTELCDYMVLDMDAPTSRDEPRPTRNRLFGRSRLCLATVQRQPSERAAVVGLGYVGLPVALVFARRFGGFRGSLQQ